VIPAQQTLRAWVNSKTSSLVGQGLPLSRGAYLRQQASPADGAYATVHSTGKPGDAVAESDPGLSTVSAAFLVFAPVEETAENAAAALASEIELLTGMPQAAGSSGYMVLVADNLRGPVSVPQPADSGEPYCFQVTADFALAKF
jgi:hypothetical protein